MSSTDDWKKAAAALRRNQQHLAALSGVAAVAIGDAARFGGSHEPCIVVYYSGERPDVPERIEGFVVHATPGGPFAEE